MAEEQEPGKPAYKVYRVDFEYTVSESASTFVVADSPESAKIGALQILAETEHAATIKINDVSIYKRDKKEQVLN